MNNKQAQIGGKIPNVNKPNPAAQPIIKCAKCQGEIFANGVHVHRLGPILFPDAQYYMQGIRYCVQCGTRLPNKP